MTTGRKDLNPGKTRSKLKIASIKMQIQASTQNGKHQSLKQDIAVASVMDGGMPHRWLCPQVPQGLPVLGA